MSVGNIGKLQENTAALCRKISQNIGRTYQEASEEHRGTVQNGCETLRVSAIRGSGYFWPGKLKRPPFPSGVRRRMWNIQMECRRIRIPDVRHPGGMLAEQNSECETSGWNVDGATPSGFSKRIYGALPYPDSLREKHTTLAIITPRTIAYSIWICCPDHWLKCTSLATSFRQPATAHVPPPSVVCPDALSGW